MRVRVMATVLLAVCWCSAALGASSVPAEIAAEVLEPARLPAGSYTVVATWPIGRFNHKVGHAIADPTAGNGSAWTAELDRDQVGPMTYGPYDPLPAGDYVGFYRIKLKGDIGESPVGMIDAATGFGSKILNSYDLVPQDLREGMWVQVPLVFQSDGKALECRVYFTGSATLMVDRITVCRRVGPPVSAAVAMVPQPTSDEKIKGLAYAAPRPPSGAIFPRSTAPANRLVVCDVRGKAPDIQFLAVCVQGLANRTRPSVYCVVNGEDPFWLDWLKKSGRVVATEEAADAEALLARYRSVVKGMIIADPALPASRNVATMMAGIQDGVVVSPRLASRLQLPVLADLRGRWKHNADAYGWAFTALWPRLNHFTAACLWPTDTGLRDYVVQHRIPVFWMPGRIDGAKPYADAKAELKVVERMLARMPANVPCMGYPWNGVDIGMGEGPGVGLMAEYGKYLVGSPGLTNVSIHSGYPAPRTRQPALKPMKLRDNKVYYSFLVSDGDNLPVIAISNWPQLWREKVRGSLPLNWTISPASAVLLPDLVDYYYSTATPNDTFMAAVSGVGYTYPQLYGKRYTRPDQVFAGFMDQTRKHMAAMDLRAINPSGVGAPEIASMARQLPGVKAIFADYGRSVSNYGEATLVTDGNVPVFHGVTGWEPEGTRERQIDHMVEQIQGIVPDGKPAFLHVFVCNWFFDLAALQEVQRRLGSGYVPVGAEQLADLYRQDMKRRVVQVQAPGSIALIEGRPLRLDASVRNLVSGPVTVNVSARREGGRLSVSATRLRLAGAQEQPITVTGPASDAPVTIEVTGPFGTRSAVATPTFTRLSEILGAVPAPGARCVATFEAEGMPYMTGDTVAVAGASGGKVRKAERPKHKPGHLVYGPYRSFPAGRYIALFRLQRTGEGTGPLVSLDAAVAGGVKVAAERTLQASALPIGQWRSVALPFTHAGGTLETRAVWYGAAGMLIDRIELYSIPGRK